MLAVSRMCQRAREKKKCALPYAAGRLGRVKEGKCGARVSTCTAGGEGNTQNEMRMEYAPGRGHLKGITKKKEGWARVQTRSRAEESPETLCHAAAQGRDNYSGSMASVGFNEW